MGEEIPGDDGALDALDRVLEELRREFRANPEFAHRIVKALGAEVRFEAEQAAELINPIELVANNSAEDVDATLMAMALADLKKLARTNQLATSSDLSGRTREDVAAMIRQRAELRLKSRSST